MTFYLRVFDAENESVFPAKLLRRNRQDRSMGDPDYFQPVRFKHPSEYYRRDAAPIEVHGAEIVEKKTGVAIHRATFNQPHMVQAGRGMSLHALYRTAALARQHHCSAPFWPAG